MNNIPNKIIQSSTPVTYLDVATPMIALQTPQMIPQISYYNNINNHTSPLIQDINSPNLLNKTNSLDFLHQQNNLQIYNSNMVSSSPNNYGNVQTPAMNIGPNDKYIKSNSPNSPRLLNSLAGSSPAQPNNITMYKSQSSNLKLDNKNSSFRDGKMIHQLFKIFNLNYKILLVQQI